MTYSKSRLTEMPKSSPEERLPEAASASDDDQMVEELPDDATLIMEVLFDIRENTDLIIDPTRGRRWRGRRSGRRLRSAPRGRLAGRSSTGGCKRQSHGARPRRPSGAAPADISA